MVKKVYIVIPAYNEEKSLAKVIASLRKYKYNNIIVVDDGSRDKTAEIAVKEKVILYKHIINKGLGTALKTGIKGAIAQGADFIVTFDADGQHNPKDLSACLEPLYDGSAEVVIGSRLLNPEGMPFIRRFGNKAFNYITYALFGIWTTDSQSGLRLFSKKAAEKIEIKTTQMEVSSEIIAEIGKNKLKYKEVPIQAIYTDYSLAHGQSSLNGVNILIKLLFKKFMK